MRSSLFCYLSGAFFFTLISRTMHQEMITCLSNHRRRHSSRVSTDDQTGAVPGCPITRNLRTLQIRWRPPSRRIHIHRGKGISGPWAEKPPGISAHDRRCQSQKPSLSAVYLWKFSVSPATRRRVLQRNPAQSAAWRSSISEPIMEGMFGPA